MSDRFGGAAVGFVVPLELLLLEPPPPQLARSAPTSATKTTTTARLALALRRTCERVGA